jgi:hypothetical protein
MTVGCYQLFLSHMTAIIYVHLSFTVFFMPLYVFGLVQFNPCLISVAET